MIIRAARPDDRVVLCALFDELDAFHREGRPDFFRPFAGPARSDEQIAAWLAGPGSAVLVAEEARELVGLVLLLTRPPSAFAGAVPRRVIEVDNIVVREGWRSRGIGRQLMDAAVEWSREQGATHIEVAVHAFNRDALRFYEETGFAPSVLRLMRAA